MYYIISLPVGPLQWMGAVRMGVQTADKNIIAIHTTSSTSIDICKVKRCVFVRNKFINKAF